MPVRLASPSLRLCFARGLRHLGWGALACSLPAQQFTSPPNVGADGDSVVSSLQPFNTSAGGRRFQYVVDDARAVPRTGGALINAIALRPDPASLSSAARTAAVTLVLDNVNYAALTTTFANNYSGNQASYTLGTVSLPATTGASGFAIALPLPTPFTYFGDQNSRPSETALLFEIATTAVAGGTLYSLDCVDGTTAPSVGRSSYLGLQPCVVPPNSGGFDIIKQTPTSAGGITTLSQHGQRGPVSTFGILAVGLTDPNTTFGGSLCAPLRANPDISINVVSDAGGSVGNFANPISLALPDLFPAQSLTLFTQFALADPSRTAPQLQVSLSDAVRFDVTPPTVIARALVYSTASAAATTGTRTGAFVPVLRCN